MTKRADEEAACAAVRRCLAHRTRSDVRVIERPDETERTLATVEQVWQSRLRKYAVEHTRIEALDGQIRDGAGFQALVEPLEQVLSRMVPGRFTVALPFGAVSRSRVPIQETQVEIARLILHHAPQMRDGETVTVRSALLRYEIRIHKRHSDHPTLLFARWLESEKNAFSTGPSPNEIVDEPRVRRVTGALDKKLPKLLKAAADRNAASVLILEFQRHRAQ